MRKLVVAVALIGICGSAGSDELTAGVLLSLCNSTRDIERTACRYYIYGAVQGAGSVRDSAVGEGGRTAQKQRAVICAPDTLPQSQMVDVFRLDMKSRLQLHPEEAKLPAVSLVMAAMNRQFPCPTQQ
jgi:hypothetical protein